MPSPTLTILYHPDLRRIGDRVRLSELALGREALLGRYQPELARPDQLVGEPLADLHISREPLRLRLREGPEEGSSSCSGTAGPASWRRASRSSRSCVFSAAEVERGVVLELADARGAAPAHGRPACRRACRRASG